MTTTPKRTKATTTTKRQQDLLQEFAAMRELGLRVPPAADARVRAPGADLYDSMSVSGAADLIISLCAL